MLKIIMDETMPLYERTTEDVKSMIKYAKLDERNLTQISQAIYYPSASDVLDKYKLLELNSHLLAEIQEGQTLCFKGALHEKVVLCSDSKTFELKEAEISNSLLVVAELLGAQETSTSPIKSPKDGVNKSMDRSLEDDDVNMEETNGTEPILRNLENRQVLKIFHEYYECREIKPKLRKIGDLLLLTRFSGPENEFAIDRNLLFSFKQLLDTAQCSRAEFQDAITQFRAIEIDNKLRVMEFEYEYRVISMMLGLINENSWDLDEINKDTTFESLVDIFPPEVVEGLFDIYTEKVNEYPCRYKYREDLVCRVIAQNILQPGLKFHVEEFLVTWQGALPENILIDEKYLKGIGIIDRDSTTPCVRALSESSLSTNLNERLNILFKTKERWTLEQIQPYIEFFTSPQLQVTAILAKYARSLVVDGVRIYVAKHR